MTYEEDEVHGETFGPQYARPANPDCPDCPDCSCCTADLCARGRASVRECAGHVQGDAVHLVESCPCSAEFTRGTLSWRAAMVRATTFATEKPLRAELEEVLLRLSQGERYGVEELLPKLAVRRYVRWRPGTEAVLTDFGWAYITARWDGMRTMSQVTVRSVDVAAGTAEVTATAYSADQTVTVPMDQVLNSRTGLTVDAFDTVLYAEVNTGATRARDVVLTKVRNPAMAARRHLGGLR